MMTRHDLRSIARWVGFSALAVGLCVAVIALAAHLPWVQARVGRWAASQLLARGITIRTNAFSYNLARLSVHVEGLVAATTADAAHPFFEADRLDVALPPAIVRGRLGVSSLAGEGIRLLFLRRQDGSTNLPQPQPGNTSPTQSPLPIGALALSDVSLIWRDEVLDMSVEADRLSLSLLPTARGPIGALTLGRPATLRSRGHETSVAVTARVGWDGWTLSVDSLRLSAPEMTLTAAGSVDVLAAGVPIAIDAEGTANLNRLAPWLGPGSRPAGALSVRAHTTGSLAEPRAELTLASMDLAWQGLKNVAVDMTAIVDRTAVDIGPVDVRWLGATAAASGRVSLSSVAPGSELGRAQVEWHSVDIARLLGTLGTKLPIDLRARLDGRANASWNAWTLDQVSATVSATAQSTAATARAIGLNGTAKAGLRAGAWQATLDQWLEGAVHLEGKAGGRLVPESLSSSTVDANLMATAGSWPDLWGMLHRLDLVGSATPPIVNGSGRAALTLAGRVANPLLGGHVDAELSDLGDLREVAPAILRPSGRLTVSADVSGTVQAPALDGRLVGDALSFSGQSADRLETSFSLTPRTLRVQSLQLTQAGGTLTGNGDYDLRTNAIAAVATANQLTLSPVPGTLPGEILVPIAARLSGEWRARGTIADLEGSGHVELDETRILERDVGRAVARLSIANRRLEAVVELPDLFTTGTATLGLAAPGALAIEATTDVADLAALATRMRVAVNVPVTGTASFATHVEGTRQDVAHLRTTLDLQRLDGAVAGVPVQTMSPGQASYDGRTLGIRDVALNIGGSELRAGGQLGPDPPGTLALSLDGQSRDLEKAAAAFLPADSAIARVQVDGRVHADLRAQGTLDRPALTASASLDEGRVTLADQAEAASLIVRAAYDAGVVTVSRLDAAWQGATVAATADIPIALVEPAAPDWLTGTLAGRAPTGRLRARIASITPAVLGPFMSADAVSQLSGLISGTLTLDADRPLLSAVHGQLVLDHVELGVAGVPFAQQLPTRVDVANGRAQVVAWDWGGTGNRVSLSGGVQFDPRQELDLSAAGTIDLRLLSALLPGAATGGRAVVDARVSGVPQDPQLDGRIELQAVEWRNASPRLAITDLSGTIGLSSDELTVVDVEGQANGGSLSIAGRLKHAGLRLTSGKLAVTGRSLAMAIPEALKTEADVELTLAVDRGAFSLTGDATVLGGSYREPISIASGLLQALELSPPTAQLDRPSAADALTLDIRLTTAEDIVVDNNYAQLALAGDVRIGGTLAAPTLIGRAEAREGGRVFLGGNVYQIVGAGAIDFANPARIEPDLSLTALTRVGIYDVTMTVKGTPATLETTLTSEPSLSQGEIVSLLVTGQTENAGALTVGSDQVIGYLSGEVLGVTGRALGLDALRIERGQDVRFDAGLVASETDPSSRLTFGKQVTRNVDVVFSQSLKDSGQLTWIIGYRPKSNIELRYVSEDNESRIYDFRHDVTIGGAHTPAAAASRPVSRVGSIAFTGTPGLPESDLRRQLRLKEGATFDFFRWQQDRDRLEAALRRDAHFEAHVSARRSGSSAAVADIVDLTYDIERGPRTIIDIVGISTARDLRRDLERLWAQAVFDGFLLDEARSLVRAAMVHDGRLRATVTTAIDRKSEDEKHLVVGVDRGPRFTHPLLRFSGNVRVSTARLAALAGTVISPWIDPAPLQRAVATMYRNEGALDAAVTIGAPEIDGAAASMPIAIAEGPLFHLGTIDVVGARGRTPEADRQAFGVEPGAPWTRAAADTAVQALTDAYRTDGFNAVRVTLTSQATRATGLVALTVNVDEGPRQILREISTEGRRRTDPALVSRELKLDVGQPVDRLAWAQARKRLYDTSVFRQVDIQAVPLEPAASAEEQPADAAAVVEQPVQARVSLEEWPPLRIRYGFEVDDQQQPASDSRDLRPGVAADATYRNVFGRAATSGLALRYTKDFAAARAFFSTPRFFGLPLTSNLFLARSHEQIGAETTLPFITDLSQFTAEQRFRAGRRLQVAYSYNFQRNHSFDPNAAPDDPLAFDLTVNIARLTATALVDTRDDLVDATRGMLVSSTFEYGAAGLGSDLRFAKYFFQQNYYRTLGHRMVFATSGRLGLAAGYGQDLIPSERFRAGGGNSVRGFRDDTLGPTNVFGDPAGGNALVVVNEELRFPIAWRFRGVAFLDAGNTFTTVGDIGLRNLRAGAGFGLRVQTPFALLRADLGAPLSPRAGESRVRWFFSIGQSF
jgi:outer membrane protein assembly factor BamA/autotransporter translocation and assembly factor TamB